MKVDTIMNVITFFLHFGKISNLKITKNVSQSLISLISKTSAMLIRHCNWHFEIDIIIGINLVEKKPLSYILDISNLNSFLTCSYVCFMLIMHFHETSKRLTYYVLGTFCLFFQISKLKLAELSMELPPPLLF